MAELIERGLGREAYRVDVANTGVDGVRLAAMNDYDALILDLILPDADGFQLLRRIGALERCTPAPMPPARDAVDRGPQMEDGGSEEGAGHAAGERSELDTTGQAWSERQAVDL